MINPEAFFLTAEPDRESRGTERPKVGDPGGSASRWVIVRGPVESIHQGLTHLTVRVKIGDRAVIRARWPVSAAQGGVARVGQDVSLIIPAAGVFLRTGHWWPGKERWNRWSGRIVLIGREQPHPLLTVKIHGEHLTLTSLHPVQGLNRRPQAWDEVDILVDPAQVRLSGRYPSTGGVPCSS